MISGKKHIRMNLWILNVLKTLLKQAIYMAILRFDNIVTYPGFDDRIYWTCIQQLQQFTNHYLTHCHLLTGHSNWNYSDFQLNWAPLLRFTPSYSFVLLQFLGRTPRKTPSSVVKNACLLVRYLARMFLYFWEFIFGNMITEPLPSNGHMRHNMVKAASSLWPISRTYWATPDPKLSRPAY
jgi:hypothetical protein